MNFCVVSCFVVFVFAQIVFAQYTLEQQQQDYLNPANQPEVEQQPPKDQDKRTIFPTTITNYAWAKHIGINTSGGKYVLGYSPVDLKYVPVVRPIANTRPLVYQLRPKWRPTVMLKPQQGGWKPIYKPPSSVYGPPTKPPEVASSGAGNSDVFLQLPVKPAMPFKPPIVVPAKPIVPLKPVFPVPVTPVQPVVPQLPPANPILFHVNRPNLPVLPLGATFPSPVLQPAALKPFLVPQPLPPPPPFTSVEFHGNVNPFVPATSPATYLPSPLYPQQFQTPYQGELPQQIPNVALEQHDVQTPQTHHQQQLYQSDFQPSFSPPHQQFYQQEEVFQQQGIQPGQTDVQFPLHLPTHPHFRPVDLPSFQPSDFQTTFQHNANVVRPSIGLQPPFQQRRREGVKVDDVEYDEENDDDDDDDDEVRNKHK